MKTELCDVLGIEYPIIQGAMAHISDGKFAATVSEAGGLGVIASTLHDGQWVKGKSRSHVLSPISPSQ